MEARSAERITAWAARPRETSALRASFHCYVAKPTSKSDGLLGYPEWRFNAFTGERPSNKQIQLVGLRHGGDQIDHSAGSLLTVECALRLPNHLNSGNVVISEIGEIERTAIDKTDRLAITGHFRCWEGDLFR